MSTTTDAQRLERAIQLLDARLAKSDLFNDGTVKVVPATANVGPLGLFAFALTTALLQGQNSTVAAGKTGVQIVVLGFGLFYGGLAQLIAGILEYQRKNTFGCVAFTSYGCFWMGYVFRPIFQYTLNGLTPQFAVNQTNGALMTNKYATIITTPIEGQRMLYALWGILTTLLWLCTFSMNLVTSVLFLSLALLFFFLAGGQPQESTTITQGTFPNTYTVHYSGHYGYDKFVGAWGFWTAGVAFYDGIAALMKEVYGRQILPVFPFKPINKITGGNFGTQRRIDTEDLEQPKA